LLIITGKGSDGNGILKQQLPRWLETDILKSKILAMTPARPEDGGHGALYVLLRRIR
jgi:DNA-nicking Smr family endonuclease